MYKLHNNLTPSYLTNILPPKVGERSAYNMRNRENYVIPKVRLSCSLESFLPSSIRLWNDLPSNVRQQPSVRTFKTLIQSDVNSLPVYYCTGKRKFNILHTRLRHSCSSLNYDLYRVNIINDPSCACGNQCENATHYFFECSLYTRQRDVYSVMFHNMVIFQLIFCFMVLHTCPTWKTK